MRDTWKIVSLKQLQIIKVHTLLEPQQGSQMHILQGGEYT